MGLSAVYDKGGVRKGEGYDLQFVMKVVLESGDGCNLW